MPPSEASGKRWYIALVDMMRMPENGDTQEVFDPEDIGGVSWMGVRADDEEEAEQLITLSLNEIGLTIREIDDCQELIDVESFEDIDEHLVKNILERPLDDRPVVWGTLHTYIAEGEA